MKLQREITSIWPLTLTAVATGLLGVWTLAAAEDFSKRLYLNAGAGATRLEPEASPDSFADDLVISDNSDTGAHLALGYDVSRFFSVEGYIADLGQAEVDFLGSPLGNVGYQVYGISALGYLLNSRSGFVPGDSDTSGAFRREGASLYGRIGWGHMINDPSDVDSNRDYPSHAAFGLGLEYGFRNGIALRTELMSFDTDAKYLNVGIVKRFGQSSSPPPIAAAALPAALATQANDDTPDNGSANGSANDLRAAAPAAALPAVPAALPPITAPVTYFDLDDAALSADAESELSAFAAAIRQNEALVRIEGHTDWLASEAYNQNLSVRRANAIASFLVGQGIAAERISTAGYGETRPVSTNNTASGRALNRRAEISLL